VGRPIDGSDDGQASRNYIATISGGRATAGGIPLARTERHPASVAGVVDHLLARGELSGLRYGNTCRSDFEPLGVAGYWVPELDRAAAGQLFREHNQIGARDSRDSRGDQESLKAGKIEERGPQKLGRRLA
jgi:hypothetical protein